MQLGNNHLINPAAAIYQQPAWRASFTSCTDKQDQEPARKRYAIFNGPSYHPANVLRQTRICLHFQACLMQRASYHWSDSQDIGTLTSTLSMYIDSPAE